MSENEITFNDEQMLHYSRQIMLPKFGIEGQQKLQNAHVVIIGLGGLGSPAAMYLSAAGIGKLTLIDFDEVEHSNLQRQIIHRTKNIKDSKVSSAEKTLHELNPETTINCINKKLSLEETKNAIANSDCVIDASDNFTARFLINRACLTQGIPLVSGAAIQYEGQISVFDFRQKDSACYACLYNEDANEGVNEESTSCSDNGILAPVVGIIGSMQALEAIKLICNLGDTLKNRLLLFDALALEWRTIKLKKDTNCNACN